MDDIGVRYFGFRNLYKSMVGQARAIICRIDDYPNWRSLLLSLARQRKVFSSDQSCTNRFAADMTKTEKDYAAEFARKGGHVRAQKLTPEQRKRSASKAAKSPMEESEGGIGTQ